MVYPKADNMAYDGFIHCLTPNPHHRCSVCDTRLTMAYRMDADRTVRLCPSCYRASQPIPTSKTTGSVILEDYIALGL